MRRLAIPAAFLCGLLLGVFAGATSRAVGAALAAAGAPPPEDAAALEATDLATLTDEHWQQVEAREAAAHLRAMGVQVGGE